MGQKVYTEISQPIRALPSTPRNPSRTRRLPPKLPNRLPGINNPKVRVWTLETTEYTEHTENDPEFRCYCYRTMVLISHRGAEIRQVCGVFCVDRSRSLSIIPSCQLLSWRVAPRRLCVRTQTRNQTVLGTSNPRIPRFSNCPTEEFRVKYTP